MPFEDFRKRGGRTQFGFPTVTLMRSGGISLNKDAYEEIGNPDKMVLAFDRELNRIGIRSGSESEDFSYPARKSSDDSWWVPGRSFLRYYDIPNIDTTKYRAEKEGEYLTINLNEKPVHRERRAVKKGRGDKGATEQQ